MALIPRTGAELQAARRQAAERYAAIAYKHTPADVLVTYRRSLSGYAWGPTSKWGKRIDVPEPTTRRRLHVYLHEVRHIVLGHFDRKRPRHVEEMEAEKFAFAIMRQEGIPVPRISKRRAKRYVARKIRQAMRNGAKHIDSEALRFTK